MKGKMHYKGENIKKDNLVFRKQQVKIWRTIKRSCKVTDMSRPRENLGQMGDEREKFRRGKREGISEILYCYQSIGSPYTLPLNCAKITLHYPN